MKQLTAEEVEWRLGAWADVTLLSLELKLVALKRSVPLSHTNQSGKIALGDQLITREEATS
jgi:hypothetical protein